MSHALTIGQRRPQTAARALRALVSTIFAPAACAAASGCAIVAMWLAIAALPAAEAAPVVGWATLAAMPWGAAFARTLARKGGAL